MTTIVVGGALANKPGNGGEAWVRMSWAVGLQRLGFDVVFVEEIDINTCLDQTGRPVPLAHSVNAGFFQAVTAEFGLDGCSALVCGSSTVGLNCRELIERIDRAELLVNISGNIRSSWLLEPIRTRAYIDIDPGFTQIWHAEGVAGLGLEGHHHFFTIGENIGTASCPIPTGDIRWRPTRQPVVLSHWPACPQEPDRGFTTVGTWRGPYGRPNLDGRLLGLKLHQFRQFTDLPNNSGHDFEAAIAFCPEDAHDMADLKDGGWNLLDPAGVTATPSAFRNYVQSSAAEFSPAQGVYVETSCGWFSDRTIRYLASGRPAVVQDTGFSRTIPVGCGLMTFATPDQARSAVEKVDGDYSCHAAAARKLAEEEFASDKVLGRFVESLDIAP